MSSLAGLPNIAFAGRPGSGVNTAISFLIEEFAYERWPASVTSDTGPFVDEACCEKRWWLAVADGFTTVRITAPPEQRANRCSSWLAPDVDHTEKYEADYTIDNSSTRGDLYDELVNVLLKERRKR